MSDFDNFRKAVSSFDEVAIRASILENSIFCFRDAGSNSILREKKWLNCFLSAISDERLKNSTILGDLLLWIEQDWGGLGSGERERILETILLESGGYLDRNACFIVSEILGEYFDVGLAIKAIDLLVKKEESLMRVYLPHAIGHLLQKVGGIDKVKLIGYLKVLKNDPNIDVRSEANAVLANVVQP